MKFNIIPKVVLAGLALAAAACTGNYEEINRNPYEVTGDEMDRDGYAMRSFLTTMQSWVIPTEVNQCQFTDVLMGGVYGGYFVDANSGFNNNSFSTYLPASNWSEVFYETVYQKISANYAELIGITQDENALAVARIIKVAGLSRVADTYGPIPYQALEDAQKSALDSEETVYKAMFADLDAAIEVLTANRTQAIVSDADRLYGGNLEKWCRLANSLKLRLAMRIVYADPTLAQQMAEEAVSSEVGVMRDNSDNAMYTGFGKDGNPFYVCFYTYKSGKGDHKVAADITAYMNGYSDPRRDSYFTASTFGGVSGGYEGLRNGITVSSDEVVDQYSSYDVTAASSLMWMNASEVAFLRAEGALRNWAMGGDAETFYKQGIELSFQRFNLQNAAAYAESTAVPAAYEDLGGQGYGFPAQSTIAIKWNPAGDGAFEENLERIITQKWIANFPLGTEAWADYRRTGYPHLAEVVVNRNADVDKQLGARRLTYPLKEYETNGPTIQAAVDAYLDGQDKMSTRLWWDCNPRIN
ncbi:SusD/RagB family nutrient-binding outer membrane lipoprotein [Alistipes sp.]|uniref:SusD/RagB family nutrient-binding outer membrane lipoprotein n=1 Tax=Alistipes sp. TaxID=1872444 RepID=UPI003AF0481C